MSWTLPLEREICRKDVLYATVAMNFRENENENLTLKSRTTTFDLQWPCANQHSLKQAHVFMQKQSVSYASPRDTKTQQFRKRITSASKTISPY